VESDRPTGLDAAAAAEYEDALEEEAFPFEEKAIEVHEKNRELITTGVYNDWTKKSLERLAVLVPGRYAKKELSSGFLPAIDVYAYRAPSAPRPGAVAQAAAAPAAPKDGGTPSVEPSGGDAIEPRPIREAAVEGGNVVL
jgi:hypothetical protein